MSAWYTIILYFFGSFGQAFAWVGGIEFYYREMPDSLKGFGQGFYNLGNGLEPFIAMAITGIVSPWGWEPDNFDDGNVQYFLMLVLVFQVIGLGWGIYATEYLYEKSGGGYEARCIAERKTAPAQAKLTFPQPEKELEK